MGNSRCPSGRSLAVSSLRLWAVDTNDMSTSARLDQVRLHLLSLSETGDEILSESIVIRDEHYVGRRFEMADHRAIWFIESDELKVYVRGDGHLITLDSSALDSSALDAAVADSQPDVLPMFTRDDRDANEDENDAVRRAA